MTETTPWRSLAVIVVLFRPAEEHLQRLIRLPAEVDIDRHPIVAVDNTPEPDPKTNQRLRDTGMDVIANRNRGGLAGAYNLGAAHVLLDGHTDGFFLLDQDSPVAPDYFAAMAGRTEFLRGRAFVAGPLIWETQLDVPMPVWPPNEGPAQRFGTLHPTQFVISSGSLVSAAAYQQVGPFREDYFIESIDIEYCFRARRHGIPVFVETALTMPQNTGNISIYDGGFVFNHHPTRYYYRARNYVHTRLTYGGVRGLAAGLRHALQQLTLVLRRESGKPYKALATLAGAVDGVLGRLGPVESRHPRLTMRWRSL